MISYIDFKPTLTIPDGDVEVKLARFDTIQYNGDLSDFEQEAIDRVNKACQDMQVQLYCSFAWYNVFLTNIMTNARQQGDELTLLVNTLSPGPYYLN